MNQQWKWCKREEGNFHPSTTNVEAKGLSKRKTTQIICMSGLQRAGEGAPWHTTRRLSHVWSGHDGHKTCWEIWFPHFFNPIHFSRFSGKHKITMHNRGREDCQHSWNPSATPRAQCARLNHPTGRCACHYIYHLLSVLHARQYWGPAPFLAFQKLYTATRTASCGSYWPFRRLSCPVTYTTWNTRFATDTRLLVANGFGWASNMANWISLFSFSITCRKVLSIVIKN